MAYFVEHRVETIPPYDVVGVQTRTDNTRAMDSIGILWGRVTSERLLDSVPGSIGGEVVAVNSIYESDHTGEYDCTIGRRVNDVFDIPEGMTQLSIPGARYAVVAAKGEVPGAVARTWEQMWDADLPRAFEMDFEVYDPDRPDEVEIWLSLS